MPEFFWGEVEKHCKRKGHILCKLPELYTNIYFTSSQEGEEGLKVTMAVQSAQNTLIRTHNTDNSNEESLNSQPTKRFLWEVGQYCYLIGHILSSTISVVEKCQRRKGLVSSKYPTARENTETGKIVG